MWTSKSLHQSMSHIIVLHDNESALDRRKGSRFMCKRLHTILSSKLH